MYVFFIKFILSIALVLLSVAFFTLFERKVLGYSHTRFGPNKVFFYGGFQPFSDALSLFMKLDYSAKDYNFFLWVFAPFLGILLSLVMWGFFGFWGLLVSVSFSFLILILISGLSVYFLLFSGWSTTTKYSLLGSYRSSAQTVSYEVVLIILFLIIVFCWCFLSLGYFYLYTFLLSFFYLCMPMLFCWSLSCIAECNRSPFDFSEGESELVSGFNTEYGGGLFSLIFIGEYSSILFFSFLTCMIFFSTLAFLWFFFFSFLYLWVRSSFPRLRYDLMMMMAWSGLLVGLLGNFFLLFLFT